MKKLLLLTFSLSYFLTSTAQPIWGEDFGTGCSQGTLASAYSGTNGAWTVSNTGQNDPEANLFFVSAMEAGMGVGNCGNGCGNNPSLLNRTLHIGTAAIPLVGAAADQGASYDAGGVCVDFNICVTTNKRAESPTIDCSLHSNLNLNFKYILQGDQGNDFATVLYSIDNGVNYTLLTTPARTDTCASGQGKWTAFTYSLPPECNNASQLKIAFNWQNNDDGVGKDPSIAVDDITISRADALGVSEHSENGFNVYPNPVKDKTKIVFHASVKGNYSIEFFNVVGQSVMKETMENFSGDFSKTFDLSSFGRGIYSVNLTSPTGREVRKIVME